MRLLLLFLGASPCLFFATPRATAQEAPDSLMLASSVPRASVFQGQLFPDSLFAEDDKGVAQRFLLFELQLYLGDLEKAAAVLADLEAAVAAKNNYSLVWQLAHGTQLLFAGNTVDARVYLNRVANSATLPAVRFRASALAAVAYALVPNREGALSRLADARQLAGNHPWEQELLEVAYYLSNEGEGSPLPQVTRVSTANILLLAGPFAGPSRASRLEELYVSSLALNIQEFLDASRRMQASAAPSLSSWYESQQRAFWQRREAYLQQVIDEGYSMDLSLPAAGTIPKDDPSIFRSTQFRAFLFSLLAISLIATLILLRGYRSKLRANASLAMKNEEIALKNSLIEKALEEKDSLLKEVHHRVKNNLQIISSLLHLQTSKFKDPAVKKAMTESQGRVKTMALIHQKLYQTEDLARINMHEYIGDLGESIRQGYGRAGDVELDVHGEGVFFDTDTAVPLGLIINELITNAFKYAFKPGVTGLLTITLKNMDEESYLLSVSDNGVGLPEDLDIATSSSLGLRLVRMLAQQLVGEVQVLRQESGTTFVITFRIAAYDRETMGS